MRWWTVPVRVACVRGGAWRGVERDSAAPDDAPVAFDVEPAAEQLGLGRSAALQDDATG